MITEQDVIIDNMIEDAVDILNKNVTVSELIQEDKKSMLQLLKEADIVEPYATIFVDHWIKKTYECFKSVKREEIL